MGPALVVALFVAGLALAQAGVWMSAARTAEAAAQRVDWDRDPPLSRSPAIARILGAIPAMRALHALQTQAGSEMTTAATMLSCVVVALLVQFLATAATGSLWAGIAAGLMAGWAPIVALLASRASRAAQVASSLPRALRALSRLASAGQGPSQALQQVTSELDGALAREFARTFAEQREGRPLGDALRALADRVPGCVDLRILVTAMVLSEESGGNLGELLQRIEGTLSARISLRQKVDAETAQSRLAAGVLAAMPPLGVIGIAVLRPDHLREGLADPLGQVIFTAAGVWMAIGILVVVRILRSRR
jgi:tight adherence protein B